LLCLPLAFLNGCGKKAAFKVGFMPKLVPIPYFKACQQGAEEAAHDLNAELVYNGPNEADAKAQIALLKQWIAAGDFDCICVACNDPDLLAPTLREARGKGITVITYDADSQPDARQCFVNQATYDAVARAMVDALAEELDLSTTNKVGILTSYINAPNQKEWADRIKVYVRDKYPRIELLKETEHGEDHNLGISKARTLIETTPDLKGIIGLTSVAVPAAAEAVRQKEKKGIIKVTGVSTPKDMRDYVTDGTVKTFILWNPIDLGYLTVRVAALARDGQMPETGTIDAGRLGKIEVKQGEVLLGKPMRFTRDNIDQFGF
jgi:ABC-type sugar transport system substrate-binding protein